MFCSSDSKYKTVLGFLLLVLCSLIACNRKKFTTYDTNYSYYLKYKSANTEVLAVDQIVVYQMKLATSKDSLFWDSQHFTTESFSYFLNTKNDTEKTNLEQLICQSFSIKDSIVLQCNATALFKDFFKKPLPYFLKPNEIVKADIWIDTIVKPKVFGTYKAIKWTVFNQASESKAIQDYLKNDPHTYYKNANIYISKIRNGGGKSIKKGDLIGVKYKGDFLDGTPFDNSGAKVIDFEYGEQAQLLPGLMRAISISVYGDSLSVIIPSVLAYGDSGSSDGFIKPFTPLVYKLSVEALK
jgi:hypothetical protein